MKTYTVTIVHDGGRARLRVAAETITKAVEMILLCEECSESAIVAVKEVKP